MSENRSVSGMKVMWLMAMFDLPVVKPLQRKYASRFRKHLLSKGFTMLQYSVYARFCSSRDSARSVLNMIQLALPPEGEVRVCMVTDKQFGDMYTFCGQSQLRDEEKKEVKPEQLMLF